MAEKIHFSEFKLKGYMWPVATTVYSAALDPSPAR